MILDEVIYDLIERAGARVRRPVLRPSVPKGSAPLRRSVRSPCLRSAPLRRSVPVLSVRPFPVAPLRSAPSLRPGLFRPSVRRGVAPSVRFCVFIFVLPNRQEDVSRKMSPAVPMESPEDTTFCFRKTKRNSGD